MRTMGSRITMAMLALTAAVATATAAAHDDTEGGAPWMTTLVDGAARDAARAQLSTRRARAIDELHRYWLAAEFPVNELSARMVNIFRDDHGRLCAVANLIHASGRDDLIDAQVRADNYLALRDLKDDSAIASWILSSGFTREELVSLQGAGYEFMGREQPRRGDVILAFDPLHPDGRPTRLQRERDALQARLSAAEATLRADSARSLEVATTRLLAARPRR